MRKSAEFHYSRLILFSLDKSDVRTNCSANVVSANFRYCQYNYYYYMTSWKTKSKLKFVIAGFYLFTSDKRKLHGYLLFIITDNPLHRFNNQDHMNHMYTIAGCLIHYCRHGSRSSLSSRRSQTVVSK